MMQNNWSTIKKSEFFKVEYLTSFSLFRSKQSPEKKNPDRHEEKATHGEYLTLNLNKKTPPIYASKSVCVFQEHALFMSMFLV